MTLPQPCLYRGTVTHRRLRPVEHSLRYSVFNVLLDVDRLDSLKNRWLSHNRWNLLSVHDRDHGAGTDTPLGPQLREKLRAEPGGPNVTRIFMFCYPRVLGYVFNPLTVYFCYNTEASLTHLVYEVNNTFGGRKSYVLAVSDGPDIVSQSCAKALYVSPFNAVEGRYSFHVKPPGNEIAVGVALRSSLGPCMKAYVSGVKVPLTDAGALRMFVAFPLMTVKIISAIHWEAARLWLKGLRLKPRPAASALPASIAKTAHDT